jgi:hypothetical protein
MVPVQHQLCEWVESYSYFTINDIPLNETVVFLTVNSSTDAKYGLWRNESRIFICTANWLYMQDMVFNYSCKITNPRPPCWADPNFVEMNDVSGMLLISSRKTLVKLPAHIIGAGIDFCILLIAVHNNESNTYGIKSEVPGCMIKVEEDVIQFLWLSEGSYRFFKHIAKIACKVQGNGLYSDCDDGDLFPLEVREMGYHYTPEVIESNTHESYSGISLDFGSLNFGNLFSKKTNTTLLLVFIIIIVIVTIIVVILLICCCCYYCPAKRGSVIT